MKRKLPLLMKLPALAVILVMSLNLELARAANGSGKVTVTGVEPATADQGQELDVYISGDRFDEGSTATFYVTGTSDDSQIVVESTVYEPATGRLKSHIKVNSTALVTDYDVEVKTSGGRRGKGTTLFKVQNVMTVACTGLEDPEPTIAFLSEMYTVGDFNTWDLYLSSSSGCDQTLLLEAAQQVRPATQQDEGLQAAHVTDLRIYTNGGQGLVAWIDSTDYLSVLGLAFQYDALGNVTPVTPQPDVLFESTDGNQIFELDLTQNEAGQFELLLRESNETSAGRWLTNLNLQTGAYQLVIGSQLCRLTDADGDCFIHGSMLWGRSPNEVIVSMRTSDLENYIFARVQRVDGVWEPPEPILRKAPDDIEMSFQDVSVGGLMLYDVLRDSTNKRGKRTGRVRENWVIDLSTCTPAAPCDSGQGFLMDDSIGYWGGAKWSSDEHLILSKEKSNGSFQLFEHVLLTGMTRELEILGVNYHDFAVSR